MTISRLLAVILISVGTSIFTNLIMRLIFRRAKFVVVSTMVYMEFNTWNDTKEYLYSLLDEYQVFILEKNEYTYITSSNDSRRIFTSQDEVDLNNEGIDDEHSSQDCGTYLQ